MEGKGKKKGKEKAASGSEFLFLNCRRLLNFFCFSFPSFFLSFVATNKPLPLPHATLVPFLYKFHHHHHHHHYRCSAFFFLPRDSCCSCSISVTLVSRTTLEKHTHTHIPTPSPAAAARRLVAVVFVEEGKKKKTTNPLFFLWKQTPLSPSGEENKKLLHLLPCGSNRVLVPAAVAISLFLSLRLSHNC